MEVVLAYIEREPYIIQVSNAGDRRSLTDKLADLREKSRDDSVSRSRKVQLAQIRLHLHQRAVSLIDESLGRSLVLLARSVDSHVILTLGSLCLSDGGIVLGLHLVVFLSRDDFLVIELLDPVERLLHHVFLHKSLLIKLIGSGDLLLAGSVLSLSAL